MVRFDVNAAHIKTHRKSGGVIAAPELMAQKSCGGGGIRRRQKP
jgi:hypothetical protein